jgi:hypothetical protein
MNPEIIKINQDEFINLSIYEIIGENYFKIKIY